MLVLSSGSWGKSMKDCNVIWWGIQTEFKLDGEKTLVFQNWSISGAYKDFITNVWCSGYPSVPQRAADYLHGHSVLDVPVRHIHMQRKQVRDLVGFTNVLRCLSALGQNLFCLFLRILAEYLSSTGNFICFMRRRSRSSGVPGLYDRDITLFLLCSSSWMPSCLQQVKNLH